MLYADPARFDARFLARLQPLLPQEKQAALNALRSPRAWRESVLGWSLLLFAYRSAFPRAALPALSFGERGKPFFKDGSFAFSISHTDTLVCFARSDSGEIGIDAQTFRTPSLPITHKVLTVTEQHALAAANDPALTFTRFWTQKEALVKQTGEGLARAFSALDFAPFANEDVFGAFGLRFFTQVLGDAVVTQCAETEPAKESREITQRDLENVLFFEKDG